MKRLSGPSAAVSSRDKILDVAEALFARRGYAGVGLREVAAAVGLGKSSLFHHFRSKGHLYYEVIGRVLGRIQTSLRSVRQRDATVSEQLDRWIDTLIDALAEHPTSARLLLRSLVEEETLPGEPPPEHAVAEGVLAEILAEAEALLRKGVEGGEFRNISISHTLQTLIGATVYHFASGSFGEDVLGQPIFSAEAVRRRKREVKDLLHEGLAARGV